MKLRPHLIHEIQDCDDNSQRSGNRYYSNSLLANGFLVRPYDFVELSFLNP